MAGLTASDSPPSPSYASLFLIFLRFGALAFGGPVAQIALIRREWVEERRWIEAERFNRLLAVMQALPGPEAHELCVHLGVRARGRLGGLLAGLGFMLPGLASMLLIAWAYARLAPGEGPFRAALLGMQAAVLAVIARAVVRIAAPVLRDRWLWVLALAGAVAAVLGVAIWIALPAAGLAYACVAARRPVLAGMVATTAIALAVATVWSSLDADATRPASDGAAASVVALFLAGLKGGLLTFGGAYTAIPFVRADTVGRGWTTDAAFLDGVGLAHVLPAPLVIFATFAGFQSGGLPGALAITAGMFLPAFAFSMILYERLEAVLDDARLHAFLTGVAATVIGTIAVAAVPLAEQAIVRSPDPASSALLFALALAVLIVWRSKAAAPVILIAAAIAGTFLLQ